WNSFAGTLGHAEGPIQICYGSAASAVSEWNSDCSHEALCRFQGREGSKLLHTSGAFIIQSLCQQLGAKEVFSELAVVLQAEKFARERGMDIVGFYHSHPNADARPSKYDLEHGWPWYSYVIVSVRSGHAGDLTSWKLREDRRQFDEEEIRVAKEELVA
ncbi:M67 family metallopeptidase, partial [bacterium]|nr:M67 family metallopeptidase [bacterium]